MSLPLNTPLNCDIEGAKVYLIGIVDDLVINQSKYIGYIKYLDGSVYGSHWYKDGKNSSPLWDIKQPVLEFGIGNWLTMTHGHTATVVAVSPHVSSKYRLIGFVQDSAGRMYPERWTFEGSAGSNKNFDLDRINNTISE